jgi:hypothetical protein
MLVLMGIRPDDKKDMLLGLTMSELGQLVGEGTLQCDSGDSPVAEQMGIARILVIVGPSNKMLSQCIREATESLGMKVEKNSGGDFIMRGEL